MSDSKHFSHFFSRTLSKVVSALKRNDIRISLALLLAVTAAAAIALSPKLVADAQARKDMPVYSEDLSLNAARSIGIPTTGEPTQPIESTVNAPSGTSCGWTAGPVSPIPILDQAIAVQGSTLYSFGGVSTSIIATSSKFDGTTWTSIAPLPAALEMPSAVSDGTFLYILGGADTSGNSANGLYKYDPVANTYTPLASSPAATATWNQTALYLNGKIYKIGGYHSAAGTTTSVNAVEIYDIATNTWTTGAPYPAAIGWLGGFVQGSFLYVGGGLAAETGSVPSTKTYRYDPATNTWDDAAIADLPLSRWGAASSATGYGANNGWVLSGGYVNGTAASNLSATAVRWNPTTNTWVDLPNMLGARSRMSAGVLNGHLYVVGGRDSAGGFTGTNINQDLLCFSNVAIIQRGDSSLVSETFVPANNAPDPGETVTYSFSLSNVGDTATTNLVATLQNSGGVTPITTSQSYGAVAPGGPAVARSFTFVTNGTCGGNVTATLHLQDGANDLGNVSYTFMLGAPVGGAPVTFTSAVPVRIPGGTATIGTADVYPTTINVSGLTGSKRIVLEFTNLSTTYPGDMDWLLVGPGGQTFVVMSDVVSSFATQTNAVVKLKDTAAASLPTTATAGFDMTGEWKPTDITAGDAFAAPAPAGPYQSPAPVGTATFASVFGTDGAAMNGTWNLYGVDDVSGDFASIGGWKLTFEATDIACSTAPDSVNSRADFDGDGKTDLSVFRPSDGNWYAFKSAGGVQITNWGSGTDTLVPGDYDNDGKADTAVYRPSTGQWFILNSSNSTVSIVSFGVAGDVPVAGDYDGDGKTDEAVYRPSAGQWYAFQSSTNTTSITTWGNATDVPVQADYDADGKTDVAVFRPSNGQWFIFRSTAGPLVAGWGVPGDKPVQADYDGDNKDDLAVYRPSDGNWYIFRSSDNQVGIVTWGNSTDVPVPGDYDGDGKDDEAVFRNGTWFVFQSTAGPLTATFGVAGDVAIPSKYIP